MNYKIYNNRICLENKYVGMVIDESTGFIVDIFNKQTGLRHKSGKSGSWPFAIWLKNSDALFHVTGAPDFSPKMKYRVRSHGPKTILRMEYAGLRAVASPRPLGVKLTVILTMAEDGECFLLKAKLDNYDKKFSIVNFQSGLDELTADARKDKEYLAVPTWGSGTVWKNPRSFFKEEMVFSYPGKPSANALSAGWLDLYGRKGGMGIGYLNRKGMTMTFRVKSSGSGVNVAWRHFNLEGSIGGFYGLEPGQSFESDEWILAPHSGDWHAMADIYRGEYERVFKKDFLDERHTSRLAKDVDLVRPIVITNNKNEIVNSFSEVAGRVAKTMAETGVPAKNILVWIAGQGPGGFDQKDPDFLPCSGEAGGDRGAKNMVKTLRGKGVKAILFYTHPFMNEPGAIHYVPEANTQLAVSQCAEFAGILQKAYFACPGSRQWLRMWGQLVKEFREIGISGLQLDQVPLQWVVCKKTNHGHPVSSPAVLRTHTAGILKMAGISKTGLGVPGAFLLTECSSDLTARNFDFWQCRCQFQPPGGIRKHEMIRYTHPERLMVHDLVSENREDLNDALICGFIPCTIWSWQTGKESSVSFFKPAVQLRQSLRKARAPGFPFGFRDDVGLKAGNPNLIAKVYTGPEGLTLVFQARQDLDSTIELDKNIYGWIKENQVKVKLKKGEVRFKVILK